MAPARRAKPRAGPGGVRPPYPVFCAKCTANLAQIVTSFSVSAAPVSALERFGSPFATPLLYTSSYSVGIPISAPSKLAAPSAVYGKSSAEFRFSGSGAGIMSRRISSGNRCIPMLVSGSAPCPDTAALFSAPTIPGSSP